MGLAKAAVGQIGFRLAIKLDIVIVKAIAVEDWLLYCSFGAAVAIVAIAIGLVKARATAGWWYQLLLRFTT
jgi:hypothetical protein